MNQSIKLSLNQAPAIIFLYGLAGTGKSFVGQLISQISDYELYEADADLTPEMHLAIKNHECFTDPMRDRFYQIVLEKIQAKTQTGTKLVVTQATYKQRHRDLLKNTLGDRIALIQVVADEDVIYSRLIDRGDPVDPNYARKIRVNFEMPACDTRVIKNNGSEEDLISQLNSIFKGPKEVCL